MSRNLKALGLVPVVLLVLSVVVASAQATPRITASEYPATISGAQVGEVNTFTLEGGRKIQCKKATYEGTYTKSESEEATWGVSFVPSFSECTATILGNVTPSTVTTNGCAYRITSETTVSATEQKGATHVKCPAGKKVEIHVWQTSGSHSANATPLCTYTIATQGPLLSTVLRLVGPGSPFTKIRFGFLHSVTTENSVGSLTNCGKAAQTGKVESEVESEARNGKGEVLTVSMDEK